MNPVTEEKLKEWRILFEERKQKKLAVKEFCKEKNLTPAQFYLLLYRNNKQTE